jgi:hypothetical protein
LHHFPPILSERVDDKLIQDVGIHNFEIISEEQVMAHIQIHTKHNLETKIAPFFLFFSVKEMLINSFRTLEFTILRLFMKNK